MKNFNNLFRLANYFQRFAALSFDPDKHSWIPKQFRELEPFQKYPHENLIKEFEQHGLKDFEEEIDNSFKRVEAAELLRHALVWRLQDTVLTLQGKISKENPELQTKQKLAIEQISNVANILKDANLEENVESMLTLSQPVKFGRMTLQAGMSLFKVYEKIRAYVHINELGAVMPKLDEIDLFKQFSKTPEKIRIVFSTQLGDLAGAACRGIESCQSLFDSSGQFKGLNQHNKRLVGTILSKYVGVIYATTGSDFQGRGSKMMYRSLVRLVYDPYNEEWVVLLDKIYPAWNEAFKKTFEKALRKHTDLKVVYAEDVNLEDFESPEFEEEIPEEYRSYQDNPLRPSLEKLEEMAYSSNSQTRLIAAQYLPESSHILLDLLMDDDFTVRHEAFARIDDYDWKNEIDNILMNLSEDTNWEKRMTAMYYMDKHNSNHKKKLFEMLNDPDDRILQTLLSTLVASYGLGEIEKYVRNNPEKVHPSIKKQILGRNE